MGAETVADQQSWPTARSVSGLRIEHILHPDFCVCIACLGAGKIPFGGNVSGPGTIMGGRRSDDQKVQKSTISVNVSNRRNQRPFY